MLLIELIEQHYRYSGSFLDDERSGWGIADEVD